MIGARFEATEDRNVDKIYFEGWEIGEIKYNEKAPSTTMDRFKRKVENKND